MTYHIFFHRIDADGWCSGALLRKVAGNSGKANSFKMHGIDYGDEFDFSIINKEDKIMIGDFSFTLDQWKTLKKMEIPFENIIWFDHHDRNYNKLFTEMPELKEISGVRDNNHAACMLIYLNTNLHSTYGVSTTVKHISKWDTWKHNNDPTILNFTAGLLMYETDPATEEGYEFWHKVFFNYDGEFCKEVTAAGRKVNGIRKAFYVTDRLRGNTICYYIKDEEYKVYIVNYSYTSSCLFGDAILNEHDACISWRFEPETGKIKGDVRSAEVKEKAYPIAFDCGGGGHPNASGFRMDIKPFMKKFINVKDYETQIAYRNEKKQLKKLLIEDFKTTVNEKDYRLYKKYLKNRMNILLDIFYKGNRWFTIEDFILTSTYIKGISDYNVAKKTKKLITKWIHKSSSFEKNIKIWDEDLGSYVTYDKQSHGKLKKIDEDEIKYWFQLKKSKDNA